LFSLHQRHINTDTEKQHSRAFSRTGVHSAAFAGMIAAGSTAPQIVLY
jgi:hypothetical protein